MSCWTRNAARDGGLRRQKTERRWHQCRACRSRGGTRAGRASGREQSRGKGTRGGRRRGRGGDQRGGWAQEAVSTVTRHRHGCITLTRTASRGGEGESSVEGREEASALSSATQSLSMRLSIMLCGSQTSIMQYYVLRTRHGTSSCGSPLRPSTHPSTRSVSPPLRTLLRWPG